MTYSVALSNNDCIFDQANDFRSVHDAIEWAMGRVGEYVMQIGTEDVCVSISIDGDKLYHYTPWSGWHLVDAAAVERLLG